MNGLLARSEQGDFLLAGPPAPEAVDPREDLRSQCAVARRQSGHAAPVSQTHAAAGLAATSILCRWQKHYHRPAPEGQ